MGILPTASGQREHPRVPTPDPVRGTRPFPGFRCARVRASLQPRALPLANAEAMTVSVGPGSWEQNLITSTLSVQSQESQVQGTERTVWGQRYRQSKGGWQGAHSPVQARGGHGAGWPGHGCGGPSSGLGWVFLSGFLIKVGVHLGSTSGLCISGDMAGAMGGVAGQIPLCPQQKLM